MKLKCFVLLLFFLVLLLWTKFNGCEARNQRHWKPKLSPSAMTRKKGRHTSVGRSKGDRDDHSDGRDDQLNPPPSSQPTDPGTEHQVPNPTTMFSVLDYGANGDGVTYDTKAFEAAWAAACKVEGSVLVVPAEFEFLVGPISFSGSYCRPNIVFQIDYGLSLKLLEIKPTALRFYGSYNVTINGITIQNSPQCHLKFDNCEVQVAALILFNIVIARGCVSSVCSETC